VSKSWIAGLALLALSALAGAEPAAAQTAAETPSPGKEPSATAAGKQPIEVTAEGGIEWDRNAQTYTARGNAHAQRGDLSVNADTLVAHYRKAETGNSQILSLEATGNVRLRSQSAVVTGDHAVYDVTTRVMTVTGKNLKLETGTDTVTARDRLEYSDARHQASAYGAVTVVRQGQRLDAEEVVATLVPDSEGKLAISKAEASGNVRIATQREFIRADHGTYDADKQLAVLTGGVKVTQDQNQLNGEYAEVDLKTGVSRLLGAPPGTAGGQVKGLVLPESVPQPGG
jgi:lipopolysaccharide export system protein LptA